MKEKRQSRSKSMQTSDIRDIVRDSMYREARSIPIISRNNSGRSVTLMNYIDSPRPVQNTALRKPEPMVQEGSALARAKVHALMKSSKGENLALCRSSYYEREPEAIMNQNELPRLSLDSKITAMQILPLESRKSLASEQEQGSKLRVSSVVAKLMGLDAFPEAISTPESWKRKMQNNSKSKSFIPLEGRLQHQVSISTPSLQKKREAFSPTRHGGDLKVMMEPDTWRQQDYRQGSPSIVTKGSKPLGNISHKSSSVFGEIEKRIEEIEFRYGKDLRALKKILESMHNASGGSENQRDSSKLSYRRQTSEQKPISPIQNKKTHEQDATVQTHLHRPLIQSVEKKKFHTTEKVKAPRSVYTKAMGDQKRDTIQDFKHKRTPASKIKDFTPKHDNLKEVNCHLSSLDKRGTLRNSERHATPSTCITHGRERSREPPLTTLSMSFGRDKKNCSKKVAEKSSRRRKEQFMAADLQSSYDRSSELSSDTRYSSYQGDTASIKSESNIFEASLMETLDTSFLDDPIKTYPSTNFLKTLADSTPSVKHATTIMEQPSPVSVLDNSFYNEDAPSPISKISTAFQEDEITSPQGRWYMDNPIYFEESVELDPRSNSENMLVSGCEPKQLRSKSGEASAITNGSACASLDRYQISRNEATSFSGNMKDAHISQPNQIPSSRILSDSEVAKQFKETRDPMMTGKWEPAERNNMKNLYQSESIVVLDMKYETESQKTAVLTSGVKGMGLKTFTKEVHMDDWCSVPHSNLEEDDGMAKLLTADMKYQSEDWLICGGEIPQLVLDIERMIFKDLISEVVRGELIGPHDLPKRSRRQLYN